MYKYSKSFKTIGLTCGGLVLLLFISDLFIPGMQGIHWFAMLPFTLGLIIYFIGILLDKEPLSLVGRIFWGIIFLSFVLPIILFNFF